MGTLVCTIEMDKAAGITVTVANADASITQTIKMNGTSIVTTVAGSAATSTITQDQSKISIACKQFEVTAEETITLSSTQASTYKSGAALTVQSAAGMTLKSDATVAVKANASLSAEASGVTTLKGSVTNVQGNLVNVG